MKSDTLCDVDVVLDFSFSPVINKWELYAAMKIQIYDSKFDDKH